MSTHTNPIGRGTDNVSVNMEHELHMRLGRATEAGGYKSKGEFIRAAIIKLLKEGATFGAVGVFWLGASLVCASGVCGIMDEARRGNSSAPRIVKRIREGNLA